MTEFNHRIPQAAAEIIEQHYYRDLSLPDPWDTLLQETASSNATIQDQIEYTALIGIQNIRQFIIYANNLLQLFEKAWFKEQQNPHFIKNYFSLLCYLVNINEAPNFKEKNISAIEKIVPILIKDQFLFEDENFNQFSIILEMILLPFLFPDFLQLLEVFKKESSNEILGNKFLEYHSNKAKAPFQWAFDKDGKIYLETIIFIINIVFFLKRTFFYSGIYKTYGYYQRLLDKDSANVFYSIPYNKKMYLLRGSSALYAGEANIDEMHILPNKNILIDFRSGLFLDSNSTARAALNLALTLNEHYSDCLVEPTENKLPFLSYKLLLEGHSDNSEFTEQIHEQLIFLNPKYKDVVKTVPNIRSAPLFEKNRYLSNISAIPSQEFKNFAIDEITKLQQKQSFQLTNRAFENVILIKLEKNEILVNEDDPSLFVYIPTSLGLKGTSKNKINFHPQPWLPIGHIGIIQKGPRTATIIAEKQLELFMVPATVYLMYWKIDYVELEFKEMVNMN